MQVPIKFGNAAVARVAAAVRAAARGIAGPSRRRSAGRRVAAVAGALGVVVTLVGAWPAAALASGSAGQHRHAPHATAGAGLTLARAPHALQAAVHRSLGAPAPRVGAAIAQAKLIGSDTGPNDNFGYSVAIYGSTAVVGAPIHNANTGAAYVFVRSGTAWHQQAKLTAAADAAKGDDFGFSVAVYGSTAVVGAPLQPSSGGLQYAGAAYVFVRSGTAWSQQAKLTAADAAKGALFGNSVAIYRSTAVVGAPEPANWGNPGPGGAYVFARSGTAWPEKAKLIAADAATGDEFGSQVGISGSTAIIGAPNKGNRIGAAYVFAQSGTAWSQQAKLTAPGAPAQYQFGFSAAISGTTAVVGAPGTGSSTSRYPGAAYVFVRSGTAWPRQAKLTAVHPAAGSYFGSSVGISGSTAVAGASTAVSFQSTHTGAAYVFARSGTAWSQRAKLTAAQPVANSYFGSSAAVNGSTAVVGAPYTGNAAYAFTSV